MPNVAELDLPSVGNSDDGREAPRDLSKTYQRHISDVRRAITDRLLSTFCSGILAVNRDLRQTAKDGCSWSKNCVTPMVIWALLAERACFA